MPTREGQEAEAEDVTSLLGSQSAGNAWPRAPCGSLLRVSRCRGRTAAQPHMLVQQVLHRRSCAPPRGVRGARDLPLLFKSLLVGWMGVEGRKEDIRT